MQMKYWGIFTNFIFLRRLINNNDNKTMREKREKIYIYIYIFQVKWQLLSPSPLPYSFELFWLSKIKFPSNCKNKKALKFQIYVKLRKTYTLSKHGNIYARKVCFKQVFYLRVSSTWQIEVQSLQKRQAKPPWTLF